MRSLAQNALLVVLIVIVINNRHSLVLFGGLHFPILLGTGWLLGRRSRILAVVRVAGFSGIVFRAFILEVIFILILVFVISGVFGLGALGLLLRRYM
jgi:hypothetical protein